MQTRAVRSPAASLISSVAGLKARVSICTLDFVVPQPIAATQNRLIASKRFIVRPSVIVRPGGSVARLEVFQPQFRTHRFAGRFAVKRRECRSRTKRSSLRFCDNAQRKTWLACAKCHAFTPDSQEMTRRDTDWQYEDQPRAAAARSIAIAMHHGRKNLHSAARHAGRFRSTRTRPPREPRENC